MTPPRDPVRAAVDALSAEIARRNQYYGLDNWPLEEVVEFVLRHALGNPDVRMEVGTSGELLARLDLRRYRPEGWPVGLVAVDATVRAGDGLRSYTLPFRGDVVPLDDALVEAILGQFGDAVREALRDAVA